MIKLRSAADRLTPHFTKREMACRCRRRDCQAVPMNGAFMQKLEALRHDWGKPLVVTSGVRCEFWNKRVGGADLSQHVLGLAVDFYLADPNETQVVAALAEKHGFGGIGVGVHLLHIDGRSGHARWTYDDK